MEKTLNKLDNTLNILESNVRRLPSLLFTQINSTITYDKTGILEFALLCTHHSILYSIYYLCIKSLTLSTKVVHIRNPQISALVARSSGRKFHWLITMRLEPKRGSPERVPLYPDNYLHTIILWFLNNITLNRLAKLNIHYTNEHFYQCAYNYRYPHLQQCPFDKQRTLWGKNKT